MSRVAIFGGTFNPIHVGHLIVAEDVRQLFELDRVIFVSSFVPPHKDNKGIIAADHRHRMVGLAVEGNPCFEASSVELDREGKSYSVDTVSYFREFYGPESAIYFIVGIDAFLELSTWRDVPGLFSLCKFIVVTRPGTRFEKSALSFLDDFGKINCHWISCKDRFRHSKKGIDPSGEDLVNVYLVESILVDISSSEIRTLVKNGSSIRYLVPEKVEKYIYQKNLFLP
jgi:nicotinate-nucleotide adenylyltransferase